jgi:hypothetical protein
MRSQFSTRSPKNKCDERSSATAKPQYYFKDARNHVGFSKVPRTLYAILNTKPETKKEKSIKKIVPSTILPVPSVQAAINGSQAPTNVALAIEFR